MNKYDKYIAYWKTRLPQAEKTPGKEKLSLHQLAKECALFLGEKFGVRRVYLIGSLAGGISGSAYPDIDLVVEGIASNQYISALTAVYEKLPPGVELDLIPLEDSLEAIKEKALTKGELLYENK